MSVQFTKWVSQIGKYPVERHEITRAQGKPYYLNTHTQIGVLHTTEGYGMQGVWNTLKNHPSGPSAPHLILGVNGEIWQCRPFDAQAAALRGGYANANAALQIEMEGFTGGSRDWTHHAMDGWDLPDVQKDALIEIMIYASGNGLDIPLMRPNAAWLDGCADIHGIWASAHNTRRMSDTFPRAKGWYFHLDVPNSTSDHYDCGGLPILPILATARERAAARAGQAAPSVTPTPSPVIQPGAPTTVTLLRRGSRGAAVVALQQALIKRGLLRAGDDDGNFGFNTAAAVCNLQRQNGLKVDGIVGAMTLAVLQQQPV
jgi:hypothetical protein